MTPYQKAFRNAIEVQDACNFIAVLHQFDRDIRAISDHMHANGTWGTEALAKHPVCILYMDKLADLQRRPDFSVLNSAWDFCLAATLESESEC